MSRSTDKLDIFTVGLDGHVYTAAWEPGFTEWHGWWQIGDLVVPQGTHVGVVSRSEDKLDIFAIGLDGRVYSAAWEPGFTAWHGWWRIGNFQVRSFAFFFVAAPVSAVSRSRDHLDVFVVGGDGLVRSAAWEPGFSDWHGWWVIAGA
ncbi:MAG: hypothetical protein NTV92_02590 [Candidatus Bipolaricaulota bacterium]|nr:hypothetical protein [Candidatus Bipolaricaulota bacterium]